MAGAQAGPDLPPDAFAVVMATGIVSVAAQAHGYDEIANPLAVLGVLAFVGLGAAVPAAALGNPARFLRGIRQPDIVLRMFTFVAACAVLRLRLHHHPAALWALGILALGAWVLLFPLAAREVAAAPPAQLREHVHGAWLLPSVATSGLAGIGADLGAQSHEAWLAASATGAWVLALGCYVGVVALLISRMVRACLTPADISPDSWILMGAPAIATLAGNHLVTAARKLPAPDGVPTALRAITLTLWVLAALWVPVLLYAEMWRFDHLTGSLHYAGAWWSAVFPLGMFSAASALTADTAGLPALRTVSLVFFWNAFALWLLVALGLVHRACRRRRPR